MNKLYWRFQLSYWLGYLLLNLLYARAWVNTNQASIGPLVLLSLLLLAATHGLRALYRRHGVQRSIGAIVRHLLWLLPLGAVVVQAALAVLAWLFFSQQNLAAMINTRLLSPVFVAYSINTVIILVVWCVICLFWLEWQRRLRVEREHWQHQLKVKELELQFLRNQINSHFLFNALNNIRALILEDASAARAAMADLATLLRGVLQEGRATVVPLQDELALVKGYLALEALQLEGRLQTEFAVAPSLLSAKVPPMLLQTLVENAISHGIARRSTGGCVRISAQMLAADTWRLQVSNPPPEMGAARAGQGIGVANTRERLRLAFGEAARLALTEGTEIVATVELPLWTS